MVSPDEFKERIRQLVSQDYRIEFLGTNFDQIVHLLTEVKADKIYHWIQEVVNENIRPIVIATKKHTKSG